jgi:hypothetical protein
MRISPAALLALGALVSAPWTGLVAQTDIRVGPMIGINNATFRGDDAEDAGSRTSFLLGGFLSFRLNRQFALEPELLYTRKGAETTFEDLTGTLALDYIQLPILAQIRFPSPNWTPYILVGPGFAFRTRCRVSVESQGVEISDDCSGADVGVSDSDISLIGGLGIEVQDFSVSLRYDHGLSRLPDTGTDNVYNQTFSITFAYAFRLGQ